MGELDQISIFPRLIKMLKAQARRQETEGTQKNLRVYHLMTPKKKMFKININIAYEYQMKPARKRGEGGVKMAAV